MNILNAISTAITGNEKKDDSLLRAAAKDKPEKDVIALVRKAFKGSSRPGTKEEKSRSSDPAVPSTLPEGTTKDTPISATTPLIDINLQNSHGYSVLMYAAQRNFNDLTRLLIDRGAKTSLRNDKKETASALTTNEGLKAFLQELEAEEMGREKDVNINDSVERLRLAMLAADLTAIYETVSQLPHPADCFRRRFFHEGDMVSLQDLMVRLGRDDVLETFVRAGGDLLVTDGRGRTALLRLVARRRLPSWPHTALARQQEAERVRFMHILLKSPACKALDQLRAMDNDGFSALQLAVDGNLDNVLQSLLDHPALMGDKNRLLVNARVVSKYPHRGPAGERSKLGDTALILAVRKKYLKVATMLVEQGQCDVNLSAQGGMTALHWAAFNGDEVMTRYLLCQREVDINARTDTGHTPLMLAIEKRYLATAVLLLGFMHTWDAHGAIASKAGMTDMERFVLEKKEKARKEKRPDPADVNIATDFGYTPLIALCRLVHVPAAPGLHTREGAASASAATLLLATSASASSSLSLSSAAVAAAANGSHYPLPALSASPAKPGTVSTAMSSPGKALPPTAHRSPSRGKAPATPGPPPPQHSHPVLGTPGGAAVTSAVAPSQQPGPGPGSGSGCSLDPVALFDLVALLLGRGAALDHKAGDGCTALMWAVYQNNKPLWHQLVTAGADIDVLDGNMQPIAERVRDIVTKTEILAAKHGNKVHRGGSPGKGKGKGGGAAEGEGEGEGEDEDELRKFTETEKFEVESVLATWKGVASNSASNT